MCADSDVCGDTRQRVLQAAGEIFAEKGYGKATIREIVERAGANVNAVNYYFRGKRELYVALFEDAHKETTQEDEREFKRIRALPNDQQLHGFVKHLLKAFIHKEERAWHSQLMLRELIEPTAMLEFMIARVVRPRFAELVMIIRQLVNSNTSDLRIRLCAESILAQCVHMIHGRTIVSKLIPELEYTLGGVEMMAKHITQFSLAALQNLESDDE